MEPAAEIRDRLARRGPRQTQPDSPLRGDHNIGHHGIRDRGTVSWIAERRRVIAVQHTGRCEFSITQ
jgi:hypothetical protein